MDHAVNPKVEAIWGFPIIRVIFLRVPIIRIIVFLGSIFGSPYFGKLPYKVGQDCLHPRVSCFFTLPSLKWTRYAVCKPRPWKVDVAEMLLAISCS